MKVLFSFNAMVAWAEAGKQSFSWVPSEEGLFQLRIGEHLLLHRARRCRGDAELIESALKSLILTAGLEKPAFTIDHGHFSFRISSPLHDERLVGRSLIWGHASSEFAAALGEWPYKHLRHSVTDPQPANLAVA